jgi:hypothetical protein
MFWGTIIRGTKGPCVFFEKEWGSVNSEVYNTHVLSRVREYCAENPGCIFMQDMHPLIDPSRLVNIIWIWEAVTLKYRKTP